MGLSDALQKNAQQRDCYTPTGSATKVPSAFGDPVYSLIAGFHRLIRVSPHLLEKAIKRHISQFCH